MAQRLDPDVAASLLTLVDQASSNKATVLAVTIPPYEHTAFWPAPPSSSQQPSNQPSSQSGALSPGSPDSPSPLLRESSCTPPALSMLHAATSEGSLYHSGGGPQVSESAAAPGRSSFSTCRSGGGGGGGGASMRPASFKAAAAAGPGGSSRRRGSCDMVDGGSPRVSRTLSYLTCKISGWRDSFGGRPGGGGGGGGGTDASEDEKGHGRTSSPPPCLSHRCDTGAVTQALLRDACNNWFFNIFELQVSGAPLRHCGWLHHGAAGYMSGYLMGG